MWWDHLRRSGFIAGSTANQPSNAFGGTIGVQTGDASATPVANGLGYTSLITCSSNLPDKVAIALDTQMDDGVPSTGAVRGASGTGNVVINAGVAAASVYQETGTNIYTLCRSF
jgi:hypothetical protein